MQRFEHEVGEAVETAARSVLFSPLALCNSILSPREQHEIEKHALLEEARERGLL